MRYDETIFKLNDYINRYNCVFWASENRKGTTEDHVKFPGVCVWCAISSQDVIGPLNRDNTNLSGFT